MFENARSRIEGIILAFCNELGLPETTPIQWKPIPFSGEWGISTSFFQLAALEARNGRSPKKLTVPQRAQQLAEEIASRIDPESGYSRVEAVQGYLNLYFSNTEYARTVIDTVLNAGSDFGCGSPRADRVMVEFAQPNTHHSFHIGHFRNSILGEALSRIVEFAGYPTIRASYPGDIGLGVITVMWMYQKFYKDKEPEGIHERGQWLLKLYVEATRLLEPKADETPEQKGEREEYDAERRELYRKWDTDDPEVRALWKKTRAWSMEELKAILELLDIHIDVWYPESEVDELAKQIVDELIQMGIADDERPEGPVVVRIDEKLGLKKEKYRTNILLRSDGTSLYLTKDLALAKVKFEDYGVDRSIYVVDSRQNLHLQQAFKILELMGFKQAEKCYHLGYGFVSLPEGAMSARKGRVVLFMDVYDEAVRRVLSEIEKKNPDMPDEARERTASQVGLGALNYAMLSVDNNKDIVFDIESALNFDGHTGPYIQNAYVRASSILRKAGGTPPEAVFEHSFSSHEVALFDLISRFPDTVAQAADEYRPLVIATYAYDLANAFHSFYHAVPVLQSETDEIRHARLRLVAAAGQTLANALKLLAISAPDAM